MVQHGPFKVEMVDAILKQPFPEHEREDGSFFVEAEPKADYLIHLQKNQADCYPGVQSLYLCFLVDGKGLEFHLHYANSGRTDSPNKNYYGPRDYTDDTEIETSLKFDVPSMEVSDEEFNVDRFLQDMGKVKVKIYEGIQTKPYYYNTSAIDRFTSCQDSVKVSRDSREKEKLVRSSVGKSETVTNREKLKVDYKPGRLLDTITIRYCSVKALQLVGVLPLTEGVTAHDVQWEHARKRNQRHEKVTPSPKKKKKIRYTEQVQNVSRDDLVHQVRVVDMTAYDSDDSSGEESS